MEIKQIAFSPDGKFLYAVDVKGDLWVSPLYPPGTQRAGIPNVAPAWSKVKGPLQTK